MDPVSQAVLGASFAQTKANKQQLGKAAIIGALAGMAPDLDIFISSSTDSLLFLEYHRQFSHSLFFIPFGGLLCAALFHPLFAKRWGFSFILTLIFSVIGFATHGLLDACTSYGTQLFWPFSHQRISWDIISIIDPLFTLPLMALVISASMLQKKHYVWMTIGWMFTYFSFGLWQYSRVEELSYQLAQQRGHHIERLELKPSFANLLVWKVVYEYKDSYFISAIKPGFAQPVIWQGEQIQKLDLTRDLTWLNPHSQQAIDIERFRWFSADFIALDPADPNNIVDVRYSTLPDTVKPLWGIRLSKNASVNQHAVFYNVRKKSDSSSISRLISMIFQ